MEYNKLLKSSKFVGALENKSNHRIIVCYLKIVYINDINELKRRAFLKQNILMNVG